MIIVPIKEGENIERALKKFKRKFEKTGIVRELRNRKTFVKKSVATDFLTKVFLFLSSRTMPVFSNLRLNFFKALSMFSPSLIGTIIILNHLLFFRTAKVCKVFKFTKKKSNFTLWAS